MASLKPNLWEDFKLKFTPSEKLVLMRWKLLISKFIFIYYRGCVSIFYLASVIVSMTNFGRMYSMNLYFVFFSHWNILMCLFTSQYQANVIYKQIARRKVSHLILSSDIFKYYWIVHNTVILCGFIITIIYWTLLFEIEDLNAANVLIHGTNTFLMFVDLIIVPHRIYVLDIIYPLGITAFYCIFTIWYYYIGGKGLNDQPFIYPFLDWSKPYEGLITVLGVGIILVVGHIFLCAVYRIISGLYGLNKAKEKTLDNTVSTNII